MTCASCLYKRHGAVQPAMDLRAGVPLECHRYPPTASLMTGPNGQAIALSIFPPTQATHWCGEYVAQMEKNGDTQ